MPSEVAVVDGAAGDSLAGALIAEKAAEIDAQQPPAPPPSTPRLPAVDERADEANTILEGRYVFFRKLDGERWTLARLKPGLNLAVENLKFRADAAFGLPFGVYQVVNKELKKEIPVEEIAKFRQLKSSMNADEGGENDGDESKAPAANGSANRTELVRKKVELKHAKKSLTLIQIEPATTAALTDYFYLRNPETVGYIRNDHASQMLHFGAVKPGIRVLIFDQCSGVVTTHVVERLGGFGRCVVLHNGKSASNLLCYHNRQFSPKVASTFRTLSVRKMLEHSSGAKPTEDAERMEAEEADGEQKHPNGRVMTESDIAFRDEKNRQTAEALEWFANERTPGFGDYDALFVVCRNAASISVLEHTFRAVRSSGNIVVYSPNSADIATSREYLEKRGCVFVDTRSSVCREIQVLKHRTHPVMQQITPGGFILSAIRGFAP